MKKYSLILSALLFFFFSLNKAHAQQVVSSGAKTNPINFPAGPCVYNWTNDNTSIGLAAIGTGNIPSFTAINTGSSTVTATIVGTPVSSVGFAYIVNAGSNNVSVINIATSTVVATIPVGANPNGVCVDPNYNEVYVVNNSDNTVSVISTLTNTVTATIAVGPSPWSVTVSQDGSRAYVADGGDNEVEVINTTTNAIVATIPAGTNPNASAVSPDGSLIYVNNANNVLVINTSTHAVVATIPVGSAPQAILITPDGSKVYEANYGSNNVYAINTATNTVAAIIPIGVNPGGGSMSPDGSLVYIANEGSNTVSVISTATNAVIKTIPVGASPWGVSVRPDGSQIYVANSGSNTISVVDASTNAIMATISVGSAPYSFGSFFTAGMNCTELVKFTITVNPTPASPATITAGTATGTISGCAGTASASPNIQQFTVSGSSLTGRITATAPAGFEVSLSPGSGYASSITIPQNSGTVSNTLVYVRSAATASAGGISGNVTLTSAGASNQTVAVTGTVNALPTVNAVANQTVNNGAATTAVNFTGTGNTFTWVNDTPGIGLAASGSGNIPSFTAVNTGSSPVVATITATPQSTGHAYIANYFDGTVSAVNLATNQVVATIPVGTEPIGVAVSPDGSRVYVTNLFDATVSVINTASNTTVATISGFSPEGIAVSPDGSHVYVADANGTGPNYIAVINTSTDKVSSYITVGSGPYYVTVSPDGSVIYVANILSNNVSVISSVTNQVIATIAVGFQPTSLVVSPDGSEVYVANSGSGSVSVINALTNSVVSTIAVSSAPEYLCLSPDGSKLYLSTNGSKVLVINTSTNAIIATVSVVGAANGVSVSPDGSSLYVTNGYIGFGGTSNSNTVSVINTSNYSVVATIPVGSHPVSFGSFIAKGTGCTGTPATFTITVNPTPPLPTITASTATGTISACVGTASASPQIQQFIVTGSGLTGNITATAPTGFEVSLAAGSGYGGSVAIPQTSGAVSSTVVYVRSAAVAPNGGISGNVTLTSAGASNQTVAVTGTVNALPTVNAVANQTVNNGAATTAVNFTGTGNTFTWVNDTPGIGLAASGTGNIASFTAVNTGTTLVKATITATPLSVGFAYIPSSDTKSIYIINTNSNTVVSTIPFFCFNIQGIAISPDRTHLYIADAIADSVAVFSTATNTLITTIAVGLFPQGVTISPNGKTIYVADANSSDISVIDASTNKVTATIPLVTTSEYMAISPDGSTLYTNGGEVINTATNTVSGTIAFSAGDMAISADGKFLYETDLGTNSLLVISTATGQVVTSIPVPPNPYPVALSPDGTSVYVASQANNNVSVISTVTYKITNTINVGNEPDALSFTPDGTQLYAVNSQGNSVSVINIGTGKVVTTVGVGALPGAIGNFVTGGTGCTGAPVTFTITVNPALPTITATTATGTISACIGTASASPQIQQFTVTGSGLTGNITATAPTGFEVSLAAGSGYGGSVAIPQTSGAVSSTVVYVRSAATASTGSVSGNVTLTSAGASNQTVAVTGTVNALPTVNAVPNQTVNNGAVTAAVNFTGTGNAYNWVNDTPGIGLAASGSGNIASFTAVNTGNSPVVATITVTAQPAAGFAYIGNTTEGTVSAISTSTNAVVSTIPVGSEPSYIAVTPDGTRAYVVNTGSNTVSVINSATNTVIATILVGTTPSAITVSADGSKVYVTNEGSGGVGSVSVISTATNTVTATIPTAVGGTPAGVLVSPDGSLLYVENSVINTLSVINTANNNIITSIPLGLTPVGLAESPDGTRIYVANQFSQNVTVINTATNTVIALVSVGLHPYGVAISPDGTKVYVSNNAENTISVISSATNTVIATITTPIDGSPTGLSVSPDGSFLYVMNYVFNDVSIINTSTNAIVATIPVGAGPQSQGNFVSSGALCTGPSMTFTITVDPGPPTITTTIATGTISACIGAASATPNIQQFTVSGSGLTGNITAAAPTGFEISLVAGSGYGSSIVLAQTGGAVKGTIVYVRSAASLPGGTTTANVLLSSPGAPNQTVSIAATVNPLVTPSLAIAPSVNNICAGTPVTFTATPTNGGISPVYQWLLNGNNTGTNSTTFSSSALANGDVVSCVMTSNATCVTPATATSNGITMNVTAIVTPSISIAASQNNICAGTAVTFTATAANGGSTPVYQWLVNGINAGTNSTTFSSSDFADGDIVSCVMTGNAACAAPASVTSNSINISVNPLVSPAISIAASQNNICPGTNVTFMATPSNGGSAPVYQWLLNGNNIGINSPTFASSTLSNGDIISCRLTGNATCLTIADATSNSLTMIVNAQAVPTVSITTSANGVCAGTPVTFTASPANGGSSPVYQWLLNGNGIGTNSAIFSSSAFANGDVVSCMMTSSLACATPASVTSNNIILNISPLPIVSGGGNKTIEKGSSVALTATASGNIADITWNPVTGLDNNKILNPKASPASTTIYTVTVQTAAGCAATDSVTVTVLYGISIPNTFTPNGDGVNDKWDIQNLKDYQNCVVSIYDRYGGEVYTSKGYYNAWDGTIKGRPCPVGTYYYLINLNNGTPPLSGFVALIR